MRISRSGIRCSRDLLSLFCRPHASHFRLAAQERTGAALRHRIASTLIARTPGRTPRSRPSRSRPGMAKHSTSAGYDKQVRKYDFDPAKGKYVAAGSFRVPIAPGNAGVVNALAVSPDGKWVAVAGRAPIRGEVWDGVDDGIDTDAAPASASCAATSASCTSSTRPNPTVGR